MVCGNRSVTSAAEMLEISPRQAHRLQSRLREGGPGSLAHRARGRPSNNRLSREHHQKALALIRERYGDFGPTLAAEMLAAHHGLTVSRETLRRWMAGTGLWQPRRQRRQFHLPRLRREHLGELVQIDGSEHRWFEDRAEPCTLLVFIDDATGRLMQLRFVASESAFSYFAALEGWLDVCCTQVNQSSPSYSRGEGSCVRVRPVQVTLVSMAPSPFRSACIVIPS